MLQLLLTYKYLILIPLAIVEGPILMVICGFLVTLGVLNPILVYAILVMGDVVGDLFQYYLGYYGKRFLKYFKITDEKLLVTEAYFKNNYKKAIVMSKVIYGIGFVGLVAGGAIRLPFGKYVKTCLVVSMTQYFIFLIIGIFFGQAYIVIEKYLNLYAAILSVIALVILLFVFIKKYKLSTKINLE